MRPRWIERAWHKNRARAPIFGAALGALVLCTWRDAWAGVQEFPYLARWLAPTWQDVPIFLIVVGCIFWRLGSDRRSLFVGAQRLWRLTARS